MHLKHSCLPGWNTPLNNHHTLVPQMILENLINTFQLTRPYFSNSCVCPSTSTQYHSLQERQILQLPRPHIQHTIDAQISNIDLILKVIEWAKIAQQTNPNNNIIPLPHMMTKQTTKLILSNNQTSPHHKNLPTYPSLPPSSKNYITT